jgi:hypothetical protein
MIASGQNGRMAGDSRRIQGYEAAVMITASNRFYFWYFGFQSPWQRKGRV